MSSAGLRFTLEVDGILEMSTAVVSFRLVQRHSVPFVLELELVNWSTV
ncbi:hypothetical protein AYT02_003854 [Salmonella enterica]|nr:hypothetical protein [Salmonella enterica]MDJ4949300.1 hypothetical protein [Salmonella enterica]HAU3346791.1 hypothetical protein [Salmonella enterica subsp. houtenae]HCL5307654.1 hypothetical protein [Salmonella enterica]